jgi:hypothetical protein
VPIEATVLLCNAATDAGGAISLLGLGWQVRPPAAVANEAIVVVLRVPRRQEGVVALRLELLRYDDETLVNVAPPEGPGDMTVAAEVTVAGRRDLGLRGPLTATFPVAIPPYPLESGTEFLWRLHVNGKTRPGWSAPFRTMTDEEWTQLLAAEGNQP